MCIARYLRLIHVQFLILRRNRCADMERPLLLAMWNIFSLYAVYTTSINSSVSYEEIANNELEFFSANLCRRVYG